MAFVPLLAVLVLAAAAAGGAAVVRRSPPSRETTVAAASRHGRVGAIAAATLAGAAFLGTALVVQLSPGVLQPPARNGVGALLAVLAFGVVHTVVLLLAELTWPRPEGYLRRARLTHRGLFDAAPPWLLRLTTGALVAGGLVVLLGALAAGPDGRSFTASSADARATSTASPFAGWFYGRPALLALVVLVVLTAATLWVVAQRPAVVTADDRVEATLRRASAHRVLRGTAATALVLTGSLTAISGTAVRSAATGVADDVLRVVGTTMGLLGLLVALAGMVVLAARAPQVPADAPSRG